MTSSQLQSMLDAMIAIVGPQGVLGSASGRNDALLVYECDGFPVAKGLPLAVVFPTDTQQVQACIKVLVDFDLQIVPRGSGTGLAGGAVLYEPGVLISTTRMNRIESIDYDNRVAVVQAGVRNIALSQAMAGTGWHYSPDPSSQRASTLGGNVATNAGGINTLKHGVTSNHVLGMEMVLTDGTILQTRTDGLYEGMGADLPGLICASEGTFGIVTRVWCRLTVLPTSMRTVYAIFDSTESACQSVADVIAKGIVPTSMEMMDGVMIQAVENAFKMGFPADAQAMLLLEIDGIDGVLDEQLEAILQICRANGVTKLEPCTDPKRRDELWSARKKAFGAVGRISHSYCTQDACIPRSTLAQAMAHIGKLGQKYGLTIANVFHAGDGNIHPIMLFDEDDPHQVQQVLLLSQEVLEYCVSIGGTITGEHGVGVEKLHLMPAMFNQETLDTFLQIKKTFDPKQRINDAKLVPSDRSQVQLIKPLAVNTPGGGM